MLIQDTPASRAANDARLRQLRDHDISELDYDDLIFIAGTGSEDERKAADEEIEALSWWDGSIAIDQTGGGGQCDPRFRALNSRLSRMRRAGREGTEEWYAALEEREELHAVTNVA